MHRLVLVAALVACGKQDAAPKRDEVKPAPPAVEQKPQKLEHLALTLPKGWSARYDADGDMWLLDAPPLPDGRAANARIERAASSAVASPEAFLHHRLTRYWDPGTTAEIESRAGVKDGFAMTVVVKAAADPQHPKRETYVVRQLGNVWYECLSEWIPDDATRDQLIALCKSMKL